MLSSRPPTSPQRKSIDKEESERIGRTAMYRSSDPRGNDKQIPIGQGRMEPSR